ncbi:tumor necrosis factor alpha-induced protein 2 [Talpa occidentalis]|uniref:tumor necrosis factor alpha-induced protein 2 n=1 Tax=Talpa occidentalis TaxID=50954 RepID=UPI00188E28DE|nr:tumor necrosis factor alpha-induced protein 2 [Talpa occidentalis]XP_037359952.1 tumor necrosis factor alpha-induced protein 2 [Talpa occidentalis]XP_037359953.1 tumor necrosis factor alpha-induced protein 2 [Talpa occidentalis]XP_037359954.1 tumor necrosis factor alpha-induced protein 2 [Talpa occidentalis]
MRLKVKMFFQGLPGRQPVPGPPDFPASPEKLPSSWEAESEASEDPELPLDAEVAVDAAPLEREEEDPEKGKKKKKSKGLPDVLHIFNKRWKKKGKPSAAEPPGPPQAEVRAGQDGRLPTVEELKADLEQGRLEAAGPLLALERALGAAALEGASAEELVRRQSKVEALYALLRDQVLGLLRRPLEAAPERLRQALAVLAEQEREDRRAAEAGPGPSALAPTRPRGWLRLWRRDVARAAEERLARPPGEAAAGRSELERAFLHMGRTMREDLEAVVERLKPVCPAELGVVAAYAESYHQHLAAQLGAMAEFELCERDTYMLLLWVQNLYPNDIINSPKLAAELQGAKLGSLLPPSQIRLLEATFLSNEAASVRELMGRALELEAKRWAQDEAPQSLDGHCHSELAIDVIQILSQSQAKAEGITLELGAQTRPVLQAELFMFLRSYQRSFEEFLERSKHLTNYRANVMANINSCQLFWSSVEKWQMRQDVPSYLLAPLKELKARGLDALLQDLFGALKPLFRQLTQTRWATPEQTLEGILAAVQATLPGFSALRGCFREELMEAVHLHLVREYIGRLSKRRLVLRTAEQQQQLAGHIDANAEAIWDFCTQHGSHAGWLRHALPALAEIIRLQDPNAIKISVAAYAAQYPDFSKGHLSAILAIKGNLSSSDARSIRSILDVSVGGQEPSVPLFSLIKVS